MSPQPTPLSDHPAMHRHAKWLAVLAGLAFMLIAAHAAANTGDRLGVGDTVRVTVFQYPDLTTETRISQRGTITFPLVGEVKLSGLTPGDAGGEIARQLKRGKYMLNPQVTVVLTQLRSKQVSVLGQVNRPGKFYLEQPRSKLSEVLALAGGITQLGHDIVTLVRQEGSAEKRVQVDVHTLLQQGDGTKDVPLANGDVIYVPRYPLFYIYGEVNRPGQYRIERDMTVQQALATGGGPTLRGTQRGMQLTRKQGGGAPVTREADPAEPVRPDDVIFVRESYF